MFRTFVVALVMGLIGGFGCPLGSAGRAQAQEAQAMPEPDDQFTTLPCSRYDLIRRQLGQDYAEEPVSLGLQSNGNLLQIFASATSGTWTIVSMAPNGTACVVAAGASWENIAPNQDQALLGSDGA